MSKSVELKRCVRCTLPETFRYIRFDSKGICNYCHNHDRYIQRFKRYDIAKSLFLDQIKKNRGKYRYDCAAGLSGGKDSTYVLYQLVQEYNLKVLAITFNNQFQNEFARQNIRRVINDLKIDHVALEFDQQQHYDLYREMTIKSGWPCMACSILGALRTQRFCFENRIPFIVHGRAPNQMLRELSPYSNDTYLPYYGWNYRNVSIDERVKALKFQQKQLSWLLRFMIRNHQEREAFKTQILLNPNECIQANFFPDFKAFFLMHEYNEGEIVEFMRTKVADDKKDDLGVYQHHDCLAHPAFMDIYRQAHGWSLFEFEIAFDVRDGRISKDKALDLITKDENHAENIHSSMDLVRSKMELDTRQLSAGLNTARRNIQMIQLLMRFKGFFSPMEPGR